MRLGTQLNVTWSTTQQFGGPYNLCRYGVGRDEQFEFVPGVTDARNETMRGVSPRWVKDERFPKPEEAMDSLGNIFMIRSAAFSFQARLEDGEFLGLLEPRFDKGGQLLGGLSIGY